MIAYSLRRKSDDVEVSRFDIIPGFLDIPDTDITVMGADENWSNADYRFVIVTLPDPVVPTQTPIQRLTAAGLTVQDLKFLLGLS